MVCNIRKQRDKDIHSVPFFFLMNDVSYKTGFDHERISLNVLNTLCFSSLSLSPFSFMKSFHNRQENFCKNPENHQLNQKMGMTRLFPCFSEFLILYVLIADERFL